MLASAVQLAAGIIFAFVVFTRKTLKDDDIHAQTGTILNVVGKINDKANGLLYETYLFRIGAVVLCAGYLLPIANLDYKGSSIPLVDSFAAIGIAGIILALTHLLAVWFKEKRIKKLQGFRSPSDGPAPIPEMKGNIPVDVRFILFHKDGRKLAGTCSSDYRAAFLAGQLNGFHIEIPYNTADGKWEPAPNLMGVWIPVEQILRIDFMKE